MSHTAGDTSMIIEMKSTFLNDLSIADAENFEPPQLSSTPSKFNINKSKRILKDSSRLNISLIKKNYQKKKENREIHNQRLKSISPIVKDNFKYDRFPELYSRDLEESLEINNTAMTNGYDDKWTNLSNIISEDKGLTNVSDLFTEIGDDLEISFQNPPKRSYSGRKRNNLSLYEDSDKKYIEDEDLEFKVTKKSRKHEQKKKIDLQEEALVQSMNEHFSDVETFSLTIE